ncbi:patatin-like phospholipase family protein [Vibrio tapetis subsp. quintayensis]|uniref:patatin-like phospholipase family protein n=1 Tax=Vibrio tapetis TaxID=52443 RepID=UPI0025B57B07|nr:patatin-like phospholipase family protein [Vibrio tapetis]MDN3681835.1 patatin-like phospholipase family protein [Vibrio tapetis subsp. quintayensis]
MKKSVSLVLGSGGARGLAHIGIIRWLEENNYHIASISGCSIGALIGGIYAAGKLDQFEEWITSIDSVDMALLLDISWQSSGIFKGDKIINTLVDLIGDIAIEDLPMPYTAVAADVAEEKEIWLNSGRLFDAIRASISLPLFFTPFVIDGVALIDGGVLNPVPIAPTFGDKTDITLAVNLGGPIEEQVIAAPVITRDSKLHAKVSTYIDKLHNSVKKSFDFNIEGYEIANQAFDAMQSTIARQKLAAYPADVTIEIARNACGTLEFDKASEMIALGRTKAEFYFQNTSYCSSKKLNL